MILIYMWCILLIIAVDIVKCNHVGKLEKLIQEISSSYPLNRTLSKSRIHAATKIRDLLETYKKEHSRQSIIQDPDSICDRKFVWTRLICSHAGNRLQEFLIEFGWAVIYNRTFLVDFDIQNCYGAILTQDWVVLVQDKHIHDLATFKGCPLINPLNESTRPVQMRARNVPFHCCNFENVDHRVIFFGGPSSGMIGLQQEASIPHPSMAYIRNRSDILFDMSRDSLAPLGFLAEYVFHFTPSVRKAGSLSFMSQQQKQSWFSWFTSSHRPFVIGLHLRHQKLGEEDDLDGNAEICLQTIRHFIPKNQKCIILLASDRFSTLKRISTYGKNISCQVKYVDRDVNLVHSWREKKEVAFSEQGPWRNSVTSMADYYFLSQSNLMIGTEQSTFSQLIWTGSSARSLRAGKPSNNFILVFRKDPRCKQSEVRSRGTKCRNDTVLSYNDTLKFCTA